MADAITLALRTYGRPAMCAANARRMRDVRGQGGGASTAYPPVERRHAENRGRGSPHLLRGAEAHSRRPLGVHDPLGHTHALFWLPTRSPLQAAKRARRLLARCLTPPASRYCLCSPRQQAGSTPQRLQQQQPPRHYSRQGSSRPGLQPATATSTPALASAGPYNPAAVLPPKVVKKILDLEFVEMAELKADIWVDDTPARDRGQAARRGHGKPPVTDIKLWLECFARMAAILATRFPERGAGAVGVPDDHPEGGPQLRGSQLGGI